MYWFYFDYNGAVCCLFAASISALRTIIIVQLLGLNKLSNAMGMIMLSQGFATLAGISTAGILRDFTGDYKLTFYFAGCCICLSGFTLWFVKKASIYDNNKLQN